MLVPVNVKGIALGAVPDFRVVGDVPKSNATGPTLPAAKEGLNAVIPPEDDSVSVVL
jgi:hypothetical protein